MNCKECEVCGATWINGQLYWLNTQKPGSDMDLNALVCRLVDPNKQAKCINPAKGQEGGLGREERLKLLELATDGFQ
jgi:hypothetical protein